MLKKGIKFLSLLLCISMLVPLFSNVALAEASDSTFIENTITETPETYSETSVQYYGRNALATMPNAEALLFAYDALDIGLQKVEAEITVNEDRNPLSIEELETVTAMYHADHPECFWFTGNYKMYGQGLTCITSIVPEYKINDELVDINAITTANEVFLEEAQYIIDEMYSENNITGLTQYQIDYTYALWLHDKITELVTYDWGPNHQTAYGALIDREVVCAGYAELYQYLLLQAGVQAWTVTGVSVNPETGQKVAHAWTLMWLDDTCVYADVTWDDLGELPYHLYFACDLNTMNINHQLDDTFVNVIPPCDTESCSTSEYFKSLGTEHVITSPSVETISPLIKQDGTRKLWSAIMYDPSGENVQKWLSRQDNVIALLNTFGTPGYSYSYSLHSIGNLTHGSEVHIFFSCETGYTLSGLIKSHDCDNDAITLQLIKQGETKATQEIIVSGNRATYNFYDVGAGEYTLRVIKSQHNIAECPITITNSDITADVELTLHGDVNGDGKDDIKDIVHFKKMLAGDTEEPEDTNDFDHDGKLDSIDLIFLRDIILNFFRNWNKKSIA